VLRLPEIWDIMLKHMDRDSWVSLPRIYELIECHSVLDDEDFYPQAPSSDIPKWKRNVRNVLQYRKSSGELRWNGKGGYLIPGRI
jgi:hypothetical protein